jgi:hypothetical protein
MGYEFESGCGCGSSVTIAYSLSSLAPYFPKTKKPRFSGRGFVIKDRQRLTLPGFILVPSALVGLTALFGMGRGDPHRYSHLKIFKIGCPTLFTRRSFSEGGLT